MAGNSRRKNFGMSESGYVYLATTPKMAHNGNYTVYEVIVPIGKLLPDKGRLRFTTPDGAVGKNLAHSLIYAGSARVKGNIERRQIKRYETPERSPPAHGDNRGETPIPIRNEVKPLEDIRKNILFLDEPFKYPEAFRIKDGDSVKVTYAFDGGAATQKCRFIDETHLTVGSNTYHISELAESLRKNGNRVEPIPNQKPMLDVLAAKYGEPLQDTAIPMTEAALRKLVGGKYETEVLYVDGQGINGRYGQQARGAVLRGKEGIVVCGVGGENNTPTSLHPYWARNYKRELSPAERPAQAEKKPSLLGKLDGAKEKAAEQKAVDAHGGSPKKRDSRIGVMSYELPKSRSSRVSRSGTS